MGPDPVTVTQVDDALVGKEAWRLRPLVEERWGGLYGSICPMYLGERAPGVISPHRTAWRCLEATSAGRALLRDAGQSCKTAPEL